MIYFRTKERNMGMRVYSWDLLREHVSNYISASAFEYVGDDRYPISTQLGSAGSGSSASTASHLH
jgi:hypothetical protein